MGYKKTVLDNGIRVISDTMPGVQSVSLGLCFEVGSCIEKAAENGICHFIEHMIFKGTRKRTAQAIALEMDRVGGHFDASTGKESTVYFAKVNSSKVEVAFEVFSDILLNSLFRSHDIEKEKRVILEEIKMVEDNPEEFIYDLFAQHVWKQNSLGSPILGTKDTISKLTRNDILSFYQECYKPQAMIVAAAGAIKHSAALKLAKKYFGKINKVDAPILENSFCTGFYPGTELKRRNVKQVHCCLGVQGFPYNSPARYPLALFNNMFGGGMSSRLFQGLREKRGLVYSVYSFHDGYRNTGAWITYAATDPKNLIKSRDIIIDEIIKARRRGFTKKELENAKECIKGSFILSLEGTSGVLSKLLREENYLKHFEKVDNILEEIKQVRLGDVDQITEKLFKAKELAMVCLGAIANPEEKNMRAGEAIWLP